MVQRDAFQQYDYKKDMKEPAYIIIIIIFTQQHKKSFLLNVLLLLLLLLFLMMCTLQVDDPFQVETDRVVIRVKATRPVVLDPQNACFTLQ